MTTLYAFPGAPNVAGLGGGPNCDLGVATQGSRKIAFGELFALFAKLA